MKAEIVHASVAKGTRTNLCDGTTSGHAKYIDHQRLSCGGGPVHLPMCKVVHKKVTCAKCLKLLKKGSKA